jgi:mycothiol synthase
MNTQPTLNGDLAPLNGDLAPLNGDLAPLNGDLISRAPTIADLEAVTKLFNDYWEPLLGVRKFTLDEVRTHMTTPGFDLETSMRVVLSPQGQMVGGVTVQDLVTPPVHPSVLGCVHADFERQGIGTYLLRWAIERARQAIARVPDGARVSAHFTACSTHEPTRRLFEKLGLKTMRHSWLMTIDLDQAPPEPEWPEGLVVRTYQERPDLRAVYRATDEAFRDAWGYVQRDEEEGLARWQYRLENDPDFDPSLWYLALDGDEIAAVALCKPKVGDDPDMGFVDILGVRRPWRRQGLALGLLHHVFGEFRRRGRKRAGLGVDTESLTGATRLYEKAGMRVIRQLDAYELELRPGKELGTQSVEG